MHTSTVVPGRVEFSYQSRLSRRDLVTRLLQQQYSNAVLPPVPGTINPVEKFPVSTIQGTVLEYRSDLDFHTCIG